MRNQTFSLQKKLREVREVCKSSLCEWVAIPLSIPLLIGSENGQTGNSQTKCTIAFHDSLTILNDGIISEH